MMRRDESDEGDEVRLLGGEDARGVKAGREEARAWCFFPPTRWGDHECRARE